MQACAQVEWNIDGQIVAVPELLQSEKSRESDRARVTRGETVRQREKEREMEKESAVSAEEDKTCAKTVTGKERGR